MSWSKNLTGNLTFKSLRPPDLTCCTKKELKEYFENSYDLNESLFTALKDDSVFYKCPDRLRLPLIFYYCHTAVVYMNKLMLCGLLNERVNFDFEEMFETGVDEMSWDDTENYRMGGSYKWPSVDEVTEYRQNVRNAILQMIEDTPLELPITMDSPWWALMMGIEHERIHIETSSVLIRQLPVDMVTKPEGWVYAPVKHGEKVTSNPLIAIDAEDMSLGKPFDFPSYGWDNEYGNINVHVPKFEASKYLITNDEFLEFIRDGGYNKRELWTQEGWEWKVYRHANHPTFWICNNGCKSGCGSDLSTISHCHFPDVQNGHVTNGQNGHVNCEFRYRAMFDVLELPMDWPVDANYHEARAFCAWKGPDYRLATEAEHNVMRGDQKSPATGVKSDIIFQDKVNANLNLKYGSSTPVNMFPASEKGFHDTFGNIWEWTEDHFNGLANFTHHLYDDFSSPCYDGRHNVIMGGSWISTGDEASRFARFAFRRHFIQHCGFRLVRSLEDNEGHKIELPTRHIDIDLFVLGQGHQDIPKTIDLDKYDVKCVKSTNLQYHFDSKEALEGILEQEFGYRDSFPVVVSNLCRHYASVFKCGQHKAIWFGSGVGRGPFCLSDVFEEIVGADFGGRFINTAIKLQQGEEIEYSRPDGQLNTVVLDSDLQASNIEFKQFTWIPNEIRKNDMVIFTFLERTLQPKAWLLRCWDIINANGIAVIASPDGTWNKEALQPVLGSRLRCISVQEVPYESSNGYSFAMVTVWTHKA